MAAVTKLDHYLKLNMRGRKARMHLTEGKVAEHPDGTVYEGPCLLVFDGSGGIEQLGLDDMPVPKFLQKGMTVVALDDLCRRMRITGLSKATKAEKLAAVVKYYNRTGKLDHPDAKRKRPKTLARSKATSPAKRCHELERLFTDMLS